MKKLSYYETVIETISHQDNAEDIATLIQTRLKNDWLLDKILKQAKRTLLIFKKPMGRRYSDE